MTNELSKEEAIIRLKTDIHQYADFSTNPNENEFWIAFDMAIKALEQQPCEDCLSREAVRRILANQRDELIKLHTVNPKDNPKADAMAYGVNWSLNTLMELPSVTPSIPDVENNFNLGYNCGYADAMSDIANGEG